MLFIHKMKTRSSKNIIYANLFIYRCSINLSLDDLYFFGSTNNSRFDVIGVRTWSLFFLSDFMIVSYCYKKYVQIL